ncbi:heme exporter protein CcmB [Allosaccharopolyspora coralli]|uniref:heme exporter protein CcmB n=1 Tax=Allosaccharopolyspora coralli TaxID=2665642 RepID=UPI001E3402DF|nr:heme exporter protein CcmB [Allosaccharopolyspora coralli]
MTATSLASVRPGPLRQCVELAKRDLRLEARGLESLLVIAPFGAMALLLAPMAVGTNTPLLRQLGPGLYWLVVLLFGVLVFFRYSASDTPAQHAALRLCGVDPVARLAGRAAANTVLLLAVEAVLAPVAIVLYSPDLTGGLWLVPMLPLVAVGLAVLGTLANALAHRLAGRGTLGPLLVVPIAVPLLLAATQVLQAARLDKPASGWLLLVLTVDLAAALLMLLLARHLEDLA